MMLVMILKSNVSLYLVSNLIYLYNVFFRTLMFVSSTEINEITLELLKHIYFNNLMKFKPRVVPKSIKKRWK